MNNRLPVILNFDDSLGVVPGAKEIALAAWQEKIRFGCSMTTFNELTVLLQQQLPADYGTVLLGSGDYHHLTWPLVERCKQRGPFQVVLFDNHPDNMRFPFGIHCGSWVRKVALLPYVSQVHVLGVTSQDISFSSAWQQYWLPLLKGKVTYWCTDVDVRWAKYFGLSDAFRRFDNPDELIASFIASQEPVPTYLTIDKDVLSPEAVNTNWDQGRMLEQHLCQVIEALKGHIIGSDITGDVSAWQYSTWWKKRLSALDGQSDIPPQQLQQWQHAQQALNARLIKLIAENSG